MRNIVQKSKISCDYIVAIKNLGNQIESIRVPITKPVTLIEELCAMVENPNRTLYDLQSKFLNDYDFSEKSWYVCYPHSYSASYLGSIKCPEIKSYNDIKESWEKARMEGIQSYKDECESISRVFDESEASDIAEKYVAIVKEKQKRSFYDECVKWINTNELQVQSLGLNHRNDILMYSKENIGWNNFNYKISDDLRISVATNFGYGAASYFFLSVKYKDLEIIPYSFIVKYYKAYMVDIIRCTRQYSPCRESWEAAFDFVVEMANKLQSNPDNFIREYVMNEVREMMSGLKSILENPQTMMNNMIRFRHQDLVINVRDILNNERDKMRAYPQECLFLFKVEKITDALYFLQSLKSFASAFEDINQDINEYIDTILAYNFELYPEIQKQCSAIEKRMELEKNKLSTKENAREQVIAQLKPLEEELESLCKDISDWRSRNNKQEEYKKENPIYTRLLGEKRSLDVEISKIINHINEYENFNKMLKKSMDLIDSVREVA